MGKQQKRRSSSKKSARSSSHSPARTSKRSTASTKSSPSSNRSRSRSRSRNVREAPRSRSASRSRADNASPKKTSVMSQTVKKFNELKSDVKKALPVQRILGDQNKISSHYESPSVSDVGLRRRNLASRMLQPLYPSNLKVKGQRFKRRLAAHYRRHSRLYSSLLILSLIALGFSYAGYTLEQILNSARNRVNLITAYIKKRR
ncbi:unnamed protein product [Gongylonema pulchrum]|uniref:Histone domain-containing protein n=1 Tax=Gongylonema pulchrum TaxID=637853 RepID=A0A183DY01_9BILA|nr:unnamed protein product [Gongylonema pulchrum]